jgi:hypothetical protein
MCEGSIYLTNLTFMNILTLRQHYPLRLTLVALMYGEAPSPFVEIWAKLYLFPSNGVRGMGQTHPGLKGFLQHFHSLPSFAR